MKHISKDICVCQSNHTFDWCEATDTLLYFPFSGMYVHVCILMYVCVCVCVCVNMC